MPRTGAHLEPHSRLSGVVRDVIIGMSDGLTVPFAIAAGLASAAATDATIVLAAVLAEIAAGSISMRLGGYLAAQTEADHYATERAREETEVDQKPDAEEREVRDIFESFGLNPAESKPVVDSLKKRKQDWVEFMMKFELGLDEPDKRRALRSAATIAGAYVVGGLIPLSPYIFIPTVAEAFKISILVTFLALVVFGYLRGKLMARKPWRSLVQTVIVGSVAAAAAFLLAKIVP